MTGKNFKISDSAQEKISSFFDGERDAAFFIGLKEGGCAGKKVTFNPGEVSQISGGDIVIAVVYGTKIVMTAAAYELLPDGSELSFVSDLNGSRFTVGHPDIQKCGCGISIVG